MDRKEMLLVLLAEECNEVGQRATKALRFGLDEKEEGHTLNNAERIVYEFSDLLTVVQLLHDEGTLPMVSDIKAMALKRKKIDKYLEHSRKCGTLIE